MVPPESDDNSHLEIGHVLFIDIVGYSKLLNEEQKERLNQLTEIVLATTQVRESTDEQLVRLPTGDGMALVFRHSAEEPARCALEIAEALQKHPELPVRMGIHSGPVNKVTDVSGRTNLAGAGINMAQRVMDCGDAGHILLSQHVADDLVHSRQWASRLRDLGECEVKHGVRLHLVNLYAKPLGNAALPQKFQRGRQRRPPRKNRPGAAAPDGLRRSCSSRFLQLARHTISLRIDRRASSFPKNRSRCCRWLIPPVIRLTSISPTACRKNSFLHSRACRTSRSLGAPHLFSSKARRTTARRSAKSLASIICSRGACESQLIGCASRWR